MAKTKTVAKKKAATKKPVSKKKAAASRPVHEDLMEGISPGARRPNKK